MTPHYHIETIRQQLAAERKAREAAEVLLRASQHERCHLERECIRQADERLKAEASYASLRCELATIFGEVKPHHGMTWNASMLARMGEVLASAEAKVKALETNDIRADKAMLVILREQVKVLRESLDTIRSQCDNHSSFFSESISSIATSALAATEATTTKETK